MRLQSFSGGSDVFNKKDVLKSFAIFSGKHLYWSLFLKKLKVFGSATLLNRDSNTGDFLWILQNFWEHLFWRTSKRCSDIKRNQWNVLSIFMFSCTNLYYRYVENNSYGYSVSNWSNNWISYYLETCKHLDKLDQKAIWLFSVSYQASCKGHLNANKTKSIFNTCFGFATLRKNSCSKML